ncbi:hypothetical protein K7432_004890 [Basidiobolus ranarum]|uniref:Uncharacterized protein n=1 Tax=Basidiobolus ranarum TaxID=34480 RepID=A0ABR2W3X6_9FUNG
MTLNVEASLLTDNTKRPVQASGVSSNNILNKSSIQPLRDITGPEISKQSTAALNKRRTKIASPSKYVIRSQISPLRRQHPYISNTRLSPLTAKMYKKMESCRLEKENCNPQTLPKDRGSKKKQLVERNLLSYFKPDPALEALTNVTKDLGEIKTLLLEVKEGNSTATQVQRLDSVIGQLESKLQSYQSKEGKGPTKTVVSNVSGKNEVEGNEIKEKANLIEELEKKLAEFEENHIPKAEYDRLKCELTESQELIDECKACLEEIDSTKPQDMSELQKRIAEQSLLIEGLQDRLAVAEFHKANYERAQQEIAELRCALEDLINENEMLHNS